MSKDLYGLLEIKPSPSSEKSKNRNTPKPLTQNKPQSGTNFLSPTSAVLVIFCFFLPWIKISCSRNDVRYISGAQLGDILWLVLVAAVIIFASFFYFRSLGNVERARPIIIISALTGLFVILYKYIQLFGNTKSGISAKDLGLTIQPGAIGTMIGLLLSFVGALTLKKSNVTEQNDEQEHAKFCTNCGSSLSVDSDFCGNCGINVK